MESDVLGLILDTSILVTAERRGHSIANILEQIQEEWGETPAALSAVTIVEFAHGIERAQTDAQRRRRQTFLHELRAAMRVHPLNDEIAERAGLISGHQTRLGIVIPLADLLIGATALHHGCDVVTGNARHFEMIPDLVVKTLYESVPPLRLQESVHRRRLVSPSRLDWLPTRLTTAS